MDGDRPTSIPQSDYPIMDQEMPMIALLELGELPERPNRCGPATRCNRHNRPVRRWALSRVPAAATLELAPAGRGHQGRHMSVLTEFARSTEIFEFSCAGTSSCTACVRTVRAERKERSVTALRRAPVPRATEVNLGDCDYVPTGSSECCVAPDEWIGAGRGVARANDNACNESPSAIFNRLRGCSRRNRCNRRSRRNRRNRCVSAECHLPRVL